ncbi:unnamed protein product, partial [marine sediment metagenome]
LVSVPSPDLWRAAFLMPVAGRCALVITMTVLPYARPEGGLGSVFYRKRSLPRGIWAVVVLCLTGWLVAGMCGLTAAAGSLVVTVAFAAYTSRKIGGATGDTLGASCEIAELVPVLTMAAWPMLMRGGM